ncbi:UDP-N-acetylmuramoyl-L-alanine--D-glutamate ligase [Nakamurella leprariae]|uniref:UDP-N-acetylmuramoylalanine--D-glutamate ligase n=1 Tax=Nakamurella leprariae TaxID=2803911 RepID=A0A938YG36_9ACTN|nr:UDP-N-acetylmuramoyl-L-alanine--D-glutamate ligase [Nakamurella leprariae]
MAGAGMTGLAVARALAAPDRTVLLSGRAAPSAPDALADLPGDVRLVGDVTELPEPIELVVTSPGLPPTHPLLVDATRRGVPIIGEVELAWRLDREGPAGGRRQWLAVTGTNGKTTTTGMLESILRAAGRRVTACGNIGWPVIEAVTATDPAQEVIAAELSSFQLHTAPTLRPRAGVVLNVAEDHLDWYGAPAGSDRPTTASAMADYTADKARVLTGDVAVAVVDDPVAATLLAAAPAVHRVAVAGGTPVAAGAGMDAIGVIDGQLVVRRQGVPDQVLLPVADIRPAGPHNVTNAGAAAALALQVGVRPEDVARGLRDYTPSGHRNQLVAELVPPGAPAATPPVRFVDDSKATNPHAAAASLLAHPRVVWVAGGQLKGAAVDELVASVADRLAGAVLLGVDAPIVASALSGHAPDVPCVSVPGTDDGVMQKVVTAAVEMAAPGDVVLLAPAAASLDMFASYAARGDAFTRAALALPGARPAGQP